MEYDNTNRGLLSKNDKGDNPNRPDYKGSMNIEGREYWLSAWIKERKDGSGKFLSINAEAKEDRHSGDFHARKRYPQQDAHNAAKANAYQPQDDGDHIPF
jgi:hypothetical protein